MFEEVLSLIKEIVSLSKKILETNIKKRIKKEEQTELLKKTISYQRNLKWLPSEEYSSQEFIENQNKIADVIKIIFSVEMADTFVKDNIEMCWALRNNASIDDSMVEESLGNFIHIANKKGYKGQ